MIKKFLRPHIKYYTLFAILQTIGFLVLLSLSGYKELQLAVIFTTTTAYVLLAIIHQHMHHSLNTKVVLEYVLFGVFGVVVSLLYFK